MYCFFCNAGKVCASKVITNLGLSNIAVAMINRTPPCHSRAGGNPSARSVRGWIPAQAGMTLACPKFYDYGYKSHYKFRITKFGTRLDSSE